MTGRRRGPDPIRDAAAYERRRYPPGYFTEYKRRQDVRTLFESVGPGPLDVLDIPCGSGRLFAPMAARGYRVVGADLSAEMLEAAHRRQPDRALRGLVRCDAAALPFRDRSFDLVVCMRFLYYFDPAGRIGLIREMARVARRGLLLQYRLRATLPAFLWKVRHAARLFNSGQGLAPLDFHACT